MAVPLKHPLMEVVEQRVVRKMAVGVGSVFSKELE